MSNMNDDKNNATLSTKGGKWVAILGAVAVVGLGAFLYTQNNKTVSDDVVAESTDGVTQEQSDLLSTVIEADTSDSLVFENVSLSTDLDADTASQLQLLQENLDKAYDRNALIFLIMGEEDTDKVAQIYNGEHQSYTEYNTNASELAYERGKSLLITDTIERVKDLTVFDTLQGVLNLAKANADGVSVEIVSEDIYEKDLTSEIISITDETEATTEVDGAESESTDVVEETTDDRGAYLYTQTRTSVVIERAALESYYNLFGEFSGNISKDAWDEVSEDDDITNDYLIYDFMTTNVDDTFSAGEYLVIDGTEYISWYFDGYYMLDDWTVDSDIYKVEGTIQEYIDILSEFQTVTLQPVVNSLVEKTEARMAELESEAVVVEETETESTDVENTESTDVDGVESLESEVETKAE